MPETIPNPSAKSTSVYRYYDRNDLLIYVGLTGRGITRNAEHNARAEWWQFVVRQEVEHHESRRAAEIREKDLIRQYRPPFNRQHNPDHESLREAYLAMSTNHAETSESPLEMFRRIGKVIPLARMSADDDRLVLRTQIDHSPIARNLGKGPTPNKIVEVWTPRHKVGLVTGIANFGPFALIEIRGDACPSDVLMAWATLRVVTTKGGISAFWIVRIDVVPSKEASSPPAPRLPRTRRPGSAPRGLWSARFRSAGIDPATAIPDRR